MSKARRLNTEVPVALQPREQVWYKSRKMACFVVMEKAAPFSEFAGCEGELKNPL